MAKTEEEIYEPELLPTDREADQQLDERLTGRGAVEEIATALRNAAFELDADDAITIATAEGLAVSDADEYKQGYELLSELGSLETRIDSHYARFDKPLNYLIGIVRKLKKPQTNQVTPVKQALSKRLGAWKYEQEQRDAAAARARQQVADLAARKAQEAKADALKRIAEIETDPGLAASFQKEAEAVRSVQVSAAPVVVTSSVPTVGSGGYTKTDWKCEFVDVKELLKAYVEGRCFLDEAAIIKGLQSSMDKQASSLTVNLTKAYPGTKGVPVPRGVARKK